MNKIKKHLQTTLLLVFLASLCSATIANAQTPANLSAGEINTLIEKITKLVDKRFVDIPAGKKVIAGITKNHKNGKYSDIKTDRDFIESINKDLYALSNDLHLRVSSIGERTQNSSGPRRVMRRQGTGAATNAGADAERLMGSRLFARPADGHFLSRVLDGNIGYVKVNGVMPPLTGTKVKEDMETALLGVKNTDAVIFDLRNAPGGVPETISLLSSYLYDEKPQLQNTYHNRVTGPNELYTRPAEVPFQFGLKRPIYILINGGTASAAEAFTYHNQQHARATVVGQTSRGAGRLSAPRPISKTLYLLVPENRSEHPVSKTGFEQIGVKPDIKVEGEDSLTVAHTTALGRLIKSSKDNSKWKAALPKIAAEKQKISGTLGEYAGKYGERAVLISGKGLAYKGPAGPELVLKTIEKDLYQIVLPPNVRSRGPVPKVRFDRNESGKIKSLTLVNPDGTTQGTHAKEN